MYKPRVSLRDRVALGRQLTLLIGLALSPIAVATDVPAYIGTWNGSGGNSDATGKCGESHFEATLDIYQRISSKDAILFDGRMRMQQTTQSCGSESHVEVRVIMVVNDDQKVELHFMNPHWIPDFLTRTGNTMTGEDANGSKSTWTKQPKLPIDERIKQVQYNLATQFQDERSENFTRKLSMFQLEQTGHKDDNWRIYNDSAMCVIEALRTQAVEQSLPLYELLSIIDPKVGGTDIQLSRALDHKELAEDVDSCLQKSEDSLLQQRINTRHQEPNDVQS